MASEITRSYSDDEIREAVADYADFHGIGPEDVGIVQNRAGDGGPVIGFKLYRTDRVLDQRDERFGEW